MSADTEYLLEKIYSCDIDPAISFTSITNKHTPCGYSFYTHCSSDSNRNQIDLCRGEGPTYEKNLHRPKRACHINNQLREK